MTHYEFHLPLIINPLGPVSSIEDTKRCKHNIILVYFSVFWSYFTVFKDVLGVITISVFNAVRFASP